MNKLHKFNEHWADDELADTNRRLNDLDDKEIDNFNEDDIENGLDELREEIITLLDNYINDHEYNFDHIELLQRMFEFA